MGTRSLTHVKDNEGIILTLCRYRGGSPTGVGQDIKNILGNTRLVAGYQPKDKLPEVANGIGCAAAYLVERLKHGDISSVYILTPGAPNYDAQYIYTLYEQDNKIHIKCESANYKSPNTTLYEGPLSDFDPEKAENLDMIHEICPLCGGIK